MRPQGSASVTPRKLGHQLVRGPARVNTRRERERILHAQGLASGFSLTDSAAACPLLADHAVITIYKQLTSIGSPCTRNMSFDITHKHFALEEQHHADIRHTRPDTRPTYNHQQRPKLLLKMLSIFSLAHNNSLPGTTACKSAVKCTEREQQE